MRKAFILAQSKVTACALENVWELSCKTANRQKCGKGIFCRSFDAVSLFDEARELISCWIGGNDPAPGLGYVLVDDVDVSGLNPVCGQSWDSAIAMLILAFPELHWRFGVVRGLVNQEVSPDPFSVFPGWHKLKGLFHVPDYDPLFDLTGLRQYILRMASADVKANHFMPIRESWSAALDDEPSYAYLHALAAYRNGFRSVPVVTFRTAKALFGDEDRPWLQKNEIGERDQKQSNGPYCLFGLSLEDICLSYPDLANSIHLSEVSKQEGVQTRASVLPGLEKFDVRIFVTSSDKVRSGGDNPNEIGTEKPHEGKLPKPMSGIFALWEGVSKEVKSCSKYKEWNGKGIGYCAEKSKKSGKSKDNGHSAPGRLTHLSNVLISRAESCWESGHRDMVAAVKGAVFSSDAYDLLGGLTPTTAVEALDLKHQFEIMAECSFSGVTSDVDVEQRFNEIAEQAHWLSQSFGSQGMIEKFFSYIKRICPVRRKKIYLCTKGMCPVWVKKIYLRTKEMNKRLFFHNKSITAALNIELSVLNSLNRVFKEMDQFDEQNSCLNRARFLHCYLKYRSGVFKKKTEPKKKGRVFTELIKLITGFISCVRAPFRLLNWCFRMYTAMLLTSFSWFVVVCLVWNVVAWGCFLGNGYRHKSTMEKGSQTENVTVSETYFNAPDGQGEHTGVLEAYQMAITSVCAVEPLQEIKCHNETDILLYSFFAFGGIYHMGLLIAHLYTLASRR